MAALTFDDIEDKPKSGALTFDDIPAPESNSSFWHNLVPTEQNYDYQKYNIDGIGLLPAKYNQKTGMPELTVPPIVRSITNGIGDLYQEAEKSNVLNNPNTAPIDTGGYTPEASPDALGVILGAALMNPNFTRAPKQGASKPLISDKFLADQRSGSIKPPVPAPISEFDRTSAATNAYAAAGQNKDLFPNLGSDYSKILTKAQAAPLPSGKLTAEDRVLNNHLEDFMGLEGKPLTIDDANRIDKSLGQKISGAFNANDKTLGTKLMNVQDDFREALVGTAAGDKLSEARKLAANNFRADDLQEILNNAQNYDNPATHIRTQFRAIAQNSRRLNSYPPEAQFLIRKIARGGVTGDALSIIGSRLGAIISTAAGGPSAGVANAAAGFAARGAKSALYAGRAEKALNATNEAVRPLISKYNTQGPAYQPPTVISGYLPAPTFSVNNAGQAATLAQREILGKSPTVKNLITASPEAKAQFSANWDNLDSAQQTQISNQLEKLWAQSKPSIAEMVAQAKTAIDDVNGITGKSINNTAMQDALLQAANPTLKDIMNMPPAEAKKYLNSYRVANKK